MGVCIHFGIPISGEKKMDDVPYNLGNPIIHSIPMRLRGRPRHDALRGGCYFFFASFPLARSTMERLPRFFRRKISKMISAFSLDTIKKENVSKILIAL